MPAPPAVIRFFAPVIDRTVNLLLDTVDKKLRAGTKDIILLVSSPGGSVHHGLSAYNYLKGIPASVTTHNFGGVDSIGVVMYCAGKRRLSVPQARFLLHGVAAQFQPCALEEKQLEERLKGLRIDLENIAGVIAATTGKNLDEVVQAMHERTTLGPEQAKAWGLVQDVTPELYPAGLDVVSIQFEEPPRGSASQ